ncbi:MAG: hypothetical protein MJ197_08655 [Bacteroidales bacterium]|nr:hypothetical protein [Bacteroidales bacterium]
MARHKLTEEESKRNNFSVGNNASKAGKKSQEVQRDRRTIAEALKDHLSKINEETGLSALDTAIIDALNNDTSIKDLKTLSEVLGQFTTKQSIELPANVKVVVNGNIKQNRNE